MRTHVLVPRPPGAVRRPPFDLLRDFDRILGEFWADAGTAPPAVVPRMDVRESDEAIAVAVDLPGMEESDIEVSLEDGVLAIRGERRSEQADPASGGRYRHVERRHGRFERAIRLPVEIRDESVTARYENGVLTVELPKGEVKPQPRTIPVTTA